jgi:ribonuclease BN (tRNA processing enzyme)
MYVQILGAHQFEASGARLTSLLIDGTLAIDAGSITSILSLEQQRKIRAVLLTHHHFDHTRDLVTLAANVAYCWRGQLEVYGLRHTLDIVTSCLLDGKMYVNFLEYPSKEEPALLLRTIEAYGQARIADYDVLAVPSVHSVPCIGYQISLPENKSLFYTGDTTSGASQFWQQISPSLLITEVSGPNRYEKWFRKTGHLCPKLLEEELKQFRRLKGYLPRVIIIHVGNVFEGEIKEEVSQVSKELGVDISLGYEGMTIPVD